MTELQKRTKHQPERTCIACRKKKYKWELIRIVRTPEGVLAIDHRGKRTGRGAYLCKAKECWEVGLKKKKLENALKVVIIPEQCAELLEYSHMLSVIDEKVG